MRKTKIKVKLYKNGQVYCDGSYLSKDMFRHCNKGFPSTTLSTFKRDIQPMIEAHNCVVEVKVLKS